MRISVTVPMGTLVSMRAAGSIKRVGRWGEFEGWITPYTAIAAGELDVVTGHVKKLTAHGPVSVVQFLSEMASDLAEVDGNRTRPQAACRGG